jgi:hypothetical protein
MSVEPVSELRHGGAEVDYTPALPHQVRLSLRSTSPFAAWWRIRFAFSGGNLVVAQVAQLHRTEAQAVLCLRRPALVKPSLMRRVRIIRNCL